jgi:hypothetical protein
LRIIRDAGRSEDDMGALSGATKSPELTML